MKWKLEFEGDWYEDADKLKDLTRLHDLKMAIHKAKEIIRTRLKYGENLPQYEVNVLEQLREALFVEGVE